MSSRGESQGTRTSRAASGWNSTSDTVSLLVAKIKSCKKGDMTERFDPQLMGATTQTEQILIKRKIKTIRKVYIAEGKYKIGWVVDCDVGQCMICWKDFSWWRLKHHCRACGLLVCHNCAPYFTSLPNIDEDNGSRVCINCFGLRGALAEEQAALQSEVSPPVKDWRNTTMFSPEGGSQNGSFAVAPSGGVVAPYTSKSGDVYGGKHVAVDIATSSSFVGSPASPVPSPGSSFSGGVVRRRPAERSPIIPAVNEEEAYEASQAPRYKAAFMRMRQLVPTDIYKCDLKRLVGYGLPETLAQRIWNEKALWLICMHKDDITKLHLADLRSKYVPSGLDITELRAIWYNLPEWNKDGRSTNKTEVSKAEWRMGLKNKLDDMSYKESLKKLPKNMIRNEAYEGTDDLELFDNSKPLKTRFDRSASFKAHAIDSPLTPVGKDDDSDVDSFFGSEVRREQEAQRRNRMSQQPLDNSHLGSAVPLKDRMGEYNKHTSAKKTQFAPTGNDDKYNTLMDEINAENETGGAPDYNIDDLMNDMYDDGEEEEEEEESTDDDDEEEDDEVYEYDEQLDHAAINITTSTTSTTSNSDAAVLTRRAASMPAAGLAHHAQQHRQQQQQQNHSASARTMESLDVSLGSPSITVPGPNTDSSMTNSRPSPNFDQTTPHQHQHQQQQQQHGVLSGLIRDDSLNSTSDTTTNSAGGTMSSNTASNAATGTAKQQRQQRGSTIAPSITAVSEVASSEDGRSVSSNSNNSTSQLNETSVVKSLTGYHESRNSRRSTPSGSFSVNGSDGVGGGGVLGSITGYHEHNQQRINSHGGDTADRAVGGGGGSNVNNSRTHSPAGSFSSSRGGVSYTATAVASIRNNSTTVTPSDASAAAGRNSDNIGATHQKGNSFSSVDSNSTSRETARRERDQQLARVEQEQQQRKSGEEERLRRSQLLARTESERLSTSTSSISSTANINTPKSRASERERRAKERLLTRSKSMGGNSSSFGGLTSGASMKSAAAQARGLQVERTSSTRSVTSLIRDEEGVEEEEEKALGRTPLSTAGTVHTATKTPNTVATASSSYYSHSLRGANESGDTSAICSETAGGVNDSSFYTAMSNSHYNYLDNTNNVSRFTLNPDAIQNGGDSDSSYTYSSKSNNIKNYSNFDSKSSLTPAGDNSAWVDAVTPLTADASASVPNSAHSYKFLSASKTYSKRMPFSPELLPAERPPTVDSVNRRSNGDYDGSSSSGGEGGDAEFGESILEVDNTAVDSSSVVYGLRDSVLIETPSPAGAGTGARAGPTNHQDSPGLSPVQATPSAPRADIAMENLEISPIVEYIDNSSGIDSKVVSNRNKKTQADDGTSFSIQGDMAAESLSLKGSAAAGGGGGGGGGGSLLSLQSPSVVGMAEPSLNNRHIPPPALTPKKEAGRGGGGGGGGRGGGGRLFTGKAPATRLPLPLPAPAPTGAPDTLEPVAVPPLTSHLASSDLAAAASTELLSPSGVLSSSVINSNSANTRAPQAVKLNKYMSKGEEKSSHNSTPHTDPASSTPSGAAAAPPTESAAKKPTLIHKTPSHKPSPVQLGAVSNIVPFTPHATSSRIPTAKAVTQTTTDESIAEMNDDDAGNAQTSPVVTSSTGVVKTTTTTTTTNRTRTESLQSTDTYGDDSIVLRQVEAQHSNNLQEALKTAILTGDSAQCMRIVGLRKASEIFSREVATELLLQVCAAKDVQSINVHILQLLVERLGADVNARYADSSSSSSSSSSSDATTAAAVALKGCTPLLAMMRQSSKPAMTSDEIDACSALIDMGADILIDDASGSCALSMSLTNDKTDGPWLLDAFESTGGEDTLLNSGNTMNIFKYVTCLILAGHSAKAATLIRTNKSVHINAEDATELMASCTGNFDNMKEPVETFELLESLGATL